MFTRIARMTSKCLEGKRKLSQKKEVIFKAVAAIQERVLPTFSLKAKEAGSWPLLNEGQRVCGICSTPKASEFCWGEVSFFYGVLSLTHCLGLVNC